MGLRLRVLLPFVLMGAVLLLALYGYWTPRYTADLQHEYRQATEQHLVSVVEGLVPLLLAHQLDAVYENLDTLRERNANWTSIRVFNAEGVMVYPLFPPPPPPPGLDVRVMEQPIAVGGEDLGRLVVGVDFAEPLRDFQDRHRQLLGITAAVLLLAIAGIWLVVERSVSRPVAELAHASRRLAAGDFDAPLPATGSGEVGELVRSFDGMRAAIRSYQAELVSRNASLVKLSRAVEQSPVSIVIADRAGRIEFVNPRFAEVMGCAAGELLGRDLSLLLGAGGGGAPFAGIWAEVAAGGVWRGEFESARASGGRFWQAASLSAVRTGAGETTHVVAVLEDISARRALEEQLRQSQKMESVGRLAGGVAHDFNNLLSCIIGFSELALEKLPDGSPAREGIERVKDAGMRAATLTRQLLAFSRKQILELKVVNLSEVVDGMGSMLRRVIGEDVTLELRIDPAVRAVRADPGQLEQILMNLAVNARDAMPDGGRLVIETANVELDEGYASSHEGVSPGPYVMLAVTDTGRGMTREVREKLFEPFFTTKGSRGTGLGLSTVYGIVKQQGGAVNVYSELGKGSTFRIYFPATGEAPGEPPASRGEPAALEGTETVLVVDDEAAVRGLAVETLRGLGYRVLEASSGEEALAASGAVGDGIDLLLTDVIMTGMNGRELAESLRERRPAVRVLFMSGYTDDIIAHHGILEAGQALLQKPLSTRALAAKVREVLDA